MKIPKCLGICLFYNDEDIVEDAILHLLKNNHEVVVWNHGSTDNTQAMIDKFINRIVAQHFLPREYDFYKILIALFILGIILHRLFCVRTTIDKLLFPNSG